MKNSTKKIIGLVIGFIIVLILSAVISSVLFYIFIGTPLEITNLTPIKIVQNIIDDSDVRLMFVIIDFAFLTLAIASSMKLFSKDDYLAKTYKVTDNIEIPMPVGKHQTQHGSSWWLPKSKFSQNFGVNTIDPENPTIKALLKFGDDMKKEVAGNDNPDVKKIISKDYGKIDTIFKKGGLTVGKSDRTVLKLTKKKIGFLSIPYIKKRKVEDVYYIADNLHSLTLGATRSRKNKVYRFGKYRKLCFSW